MTDANPYSAPAAQLDPGAAPDARALDAATLDAALAELDAHLADPRNVEADRRLEDGYLPTSTAVALALLALSIVIPAALAFSSGETDFVALSVPFAIAAFIVALVVLVRAVTIGRRASAVTPRDAALQHYRAMIVGRAGTVVAGLSPSARRSDAEPPRIPPVETGQGLFRLERPAVARRFLKTFARTGAGQVRWVKLKDVTEVDAPLRHPRLKACRVTIQFRTWPQWANYLSLAIFLLVSLLGLILAIVLYYTLRRTRTVTFDKTFILGRDGLWYALLPDPIERLVS